MVKMEGFRSLQNKLKHLERLALKDDRAATVVGYTKNYAVHVHENVNAHHPVGEAKYLEKPARQYQKQIARIVTKTVTSVGSLTKGLLAGGLFLLARSQEIVPVDTGDLRASGYVGNKVRPNTAPKRKTKKRRR